MSLDSTVYLVEDDAAVRHALDLLLEARGLRRRVYASGQEFIDDYDPAHPGCLVTDLRMQGMSGLDVQKALLAKGHHIPVIFITGYGDVPQAVRAMKGGAVDFLQKPFENEILIAAIEKALAQEEASRLLRAEAHDAAARLQTLTPREVQVMEMVVEGKANKVIAADLELSIKTVEFHRAHVMEKMKVDSVAELVRIVMAARDLANDTAPNKRMQDEG